jgi:hypothetical protein
MFDLPNLTPHAFARFHPPAQLIFKKTHADLHLHLAITGFP